MTSYLGRETDPRVKPEWGAQLNFEHPLAASANGIWPLLENTGTSTVNLVRDNPLLFNGALTWTPGPDGPAINFPGAITAYLQTAGAVLNPFLSDITAALWFKINSGATTQILIQQLDGTKSIGGTGTGRTWLDVLTSGGVGKLNSFLGAGNTTGSTTITTTDWHHAAITCQGSLISLYLDGRLEATNTLAPEDNAAELRIGMGKGSINALNGQVGRMGVELWPVALPLGAIQGLYRDVYALLAPLSTRRFYRSVATVGGTGGRVMIGSRLIRAAR